LNVKGTRLTVVRHGPWIAAASVVLAFVIVGASRLDRLPLISGDEPWIAEPGYRFWTEGRFGCDMLAGFFGSERRCVGFMPLFSLLSGGAIAVLGVGLVPMRLTSLLLGTLAVALTFALGRRLASPAHGAWAAFIVALWPIAVAEPSYPLGIPLLDAARLARYDIGPAAFGVAAVVVALGGDATRRLRARALVVGLLVALATLCHVYGIFWLPCAAGAWWVVSRRAWSRSEGLCLAAGCAAPLMVWFAFATADWPAFVGQHLRNAPRTRLGDVGFYVDNLANGWRRFYALLRAAADGRVVTWVWGLLLVAGAIVAVGDRGRRGIRFALVCFLSILAGYSLLIQPQRPGYVAAIWPLAAVVAASGVVDAVGALGSRLRIAAVVAILGVAAMGVGATIARLYEAPAAAAYPTLTATLRSRVPAGGKLLTLTAYWPALEGHVREFRAINAGTLMRVRRDLMGPWSLSVADALDAERADHLLLDEPTLRFLDGGPTTSDPDIAGELIAYLAGRTCRIDHWTHPAYGRFALYDLRRPACQP
jgi:hypothetical protein